MNRPYTAWRLTSLLIILLLSTSVIVSIISVNQPFANSLGQNHLTIKIMILFPWMGSTLHAHVAHILSWPWLMVTMITQQGASNLMMVVSATALCAQWFCGEQRLMLLGSITTISGVALLCYHHFIDFFLPIHHMPHAQYFQIEPPLMLALSLLNIALAILLSVVLKTHYRHTKSFDLYAAN